MGQVGQAVDGIAVGRLAIEHRTKRHGTQAKRAALQKGPPGLECVEFVQCVHFLSAFNFLAVLLP